MKNSLKIALYSGEIPSTTFIERLVSGLSEEGCAIFLFGYITKKIKYKGNVIIIGYAENRFYKMYLLLKYTVLLFLFRNQEKQQLDAYIAKESKKKAFAKMKYYPVLWHKPDVFHLQWAKSIEDWIWVQDFGIKLVVSLRGTHITTTPLSDERVANRYVKFFPKVDGFHAVSKAMALEAQKYGADSNKIKVVYSGLPKVTMVPEKIKENKVLKIISIGRNHWIKGYSHALECCRILKENQFEFEYTIIGALGAEELEFSKDNFGLKEKVFFTGNKSFREVQEYIIDADVLLLSSVEEGIANTVLEAMQLGKIVIATDCGGMTEVIENEKNGFIVPVRNPQKMAEAIMKIASLEESVKQNMGHEAMKTIQRNHTEEKMITYMMALYKEVSNQKEKSIFKVK